MVSYKNVKYNRETLPPPFFCRSVTVQCTRDGQFVVVIAREVTLPHTDMNSVSLLEADDPSCSPVDETSAFVIFQFHVTACGTTIKVSDVLLYVLFSFINAKSVIYRCLIPDQ